jgi:hypothetical protein
MCMCVCVCDQEPHSHLAVFVIEREGLARLDFIQVSPPLTHDYLDPFNATDLLEVRNRHGACLNHHL